LASPPSWKLGIIDTLSSHAFNISSADIPWTTRSNCPGDYRNTIIHTNTMVECSVIIKLELQKFGRFIYYLFPFARHKEFHLNKQPS
jgi:hypothetical protein